MLLAGCEDGSLRTAVHCTQALHCVHACVPMHVAHPRRCLRTEDAGEGRAATLAGMAALDGCCVALGPAAAGCFHDPALRLCE
jgi:hypothetical protein